MNAAKRIMNRLRRIIRRPAELPVIETATEDLSDGLPVLDAYDRVNRMLDVLGAVLERSLYGDFADMELACLEWPAMLGDMADALGLEPGWGLTDLDQRIAALREAAISAPGE